jgi:hypothetical protein
MGMTITILPTRDANGVDGDGEDVDLARIESSVGDDRTVSIDEFNSFEENSSSRHTAATGQAVPRWWILLSNQSTVDVFLQSSFAQEH